MIVSFLCYFMTFCQRRVDTPALPSVGVVNVESDRRERMVCWYYPRLCSAELKNLKKSSLRIADLGTNVRIREVRSEYLNTRRNLMLIGSQQGFKPSTRQEYGCSAETRREWSCRVVFSHGNCAQGAHNKRRCCIKSTISLRKS